jgi:hypothetical protein
VCARDDCFWNYTDVSESNPDGKQWCTEWNPPSGISGGFVSAIFGEGYTWNKAKILARGYMKGSMDAFRPEPDRYGRTIDDSYADGLALSYGYPRNHIHMWTVGLSKGLMDFSYLLMETVHATTEQNSLPHGLETDITAIQESQVIFITMVELKKLAGMMAITTF